MARALTREQELKKAIEQADLPPRDYRILCALLARAKWKSAEIEERYQPRGLAELAAWCRMSKRNLCYGLDSLEAAGWIERARFARPGRGHFTAYQLSIGTPIANGSVTDRTCDWPEVAKPAQAASPDPSPMGSANPSGPPRSVSQGDISGPDEVCKPWTLYGQEVSKKVPVKCPDHLDVSAGQRPVCAKSVSDEEEVVRTYPEKESERSEGRALTEVPRLPADSFWHIAMNKLYDEERP